MIVAVAVGEQEVRLETEGDDDAGAADAEDKAEVVDDQQEPENLPGVYRRGSKERRSS